MDASSPLSGIRVVEITSIYSGPLAGLLLVGLDVIGECLTEINVTSPTCFREITEQSGFNVAGMFLDALEAASQEMCDPGDSCGNHLKRMSQDVNDVSAIVQPGQALFDEVASA